MIRICFFQLLMKINLPICLIPVKDKISSDTLLVFLNYRIKKSCKELKHTVQKQDHLETIHNQSEQLKMIGSLKKIIAEIIYDLYRIHTVSLGDSNRNILPV